MPANLRCAFGKCSLDDRCCDMGGDTLPLIGFDGPNPQFMATLVLVLGQTPANELATVQRAEAEAVTEKVLE